jgi:predicted nuclease of predicted toxin-antitoxin system
VKLLLDENLSPRLVPALPENFPESAHVRDLELQSAADEDVWERAHEDGYAIVSKDSDFLHRGLLRGFPPKIVWVRLGNCTTQEVLDVLDVLEENAELLRQFDRDREQSVLLLP